jgi:pyrimidine-nucleoside phosphorylase
LNIQGIIAKRRDKQPHTQEELQYLAHGAADGSIEDYHLSAWLMAAYLHPLEEQETAWLTQAMATSGERLDLSGLPKPWVDKHSTGGVGDKASIVLLPLLASCGLTVVKMSGKGLGITGGTVDKLSSVPGFRLDLTPQEMRDQAQRIGIALTGQTPNLAPADKVLYALRDATTTVGSIPLIVSSILSKKIAGGAEMIVLDVKAGSGAFMKTALKAKELAAALKRTAELCGLQARLAITDMSQPLGRAVGNALEVAEAIEVLEGRGAGRFQQLCMRLCGLTLMAAGAVASEKEGEDLALSKLESGAALRKAKEWFAAQGAAWPTETLPSAPVQKKVFHQGTAGWAWVVDAQTVGEVVVELGGGRREKDDEIDLAVGVEVHVEVGTQVEHSQLLFTVHAADEAHADAAAQRLVEAVEIVTEPVRKPGLVLEVM